MMRCKPALLSGVAIAFMCLASNPWLSPAEATTINLVDKNAAVTIDPNAGMTSWTVDGVEQLENQWFWFRIGTIGPESPIHAVPLVSQSSSDDDFDAGDEFAQLTYTDPNNFTFQVQFELTGTGGGQANVSEVVTFTNLSTTAPLDLHLFQYANFDFGGDATDTSISILNPNNTVQQNDLLGALIEEMETAAVPIPTGYDVGPPSLFVGGGLGLLDDANADNLGNNNGPVGPGDLASAFQWDVTLDPGGSLLLSINKLILTRPIEIPAPAAAPVGLWMICMIAGRRRR
ncbi:MAG: hypothetical protein CMJ49_09610 [Planctomycetaceae bacterium]|nr:hypothetical protein [Planctomycetaceae bacterium]